jgi:hypothetical protein
MKRRIAILFHEKQRDQPLNYLINRCAEIWREDGHEVILLFGVGQFVPADLVIVHVDLSVVPDEYLEFARRYPIALNDQVKDIRKSTYSQLLLEAGDPYDGKVIVKSNYNFAAVPERSLGISLDPSGFSASFFMSALDYQIFENPQAVPPVLFTDPNIVVEKFQPEMEGGLYYVRTMGFLGNRIVCSRIASPHPIVKHANRVGIEQIEPHPDIVRRAEEMKFDYGKFDYVIHEGRAVLLDINKTMGAANLPPTLANLASRRYRAEGLYSYFDRARPGITP